MVCNYSCAKNGSVDIFEKFLLFSIFGSILHPWPLERGGSKMRDFELKCRFVFPPNPPQPPPMQKKSTTTTRRKFIIGAIGVIKTFGQCPLQPRFFLMDLSPWHSVMVLTPKVPFDKWQYVGERAVFPLWLVFAPLFRNWIKVSRIRPVSHIGPPNNKLKMQNITCYSYRIEPSENK